MRALFFARSPPSIFVSAKSFSQRRRALLVSTAANENAMANANQADLGGVWSLSRRNGR